MKYLPVIIISLCVLIESCVFVTYIGDKYPPTTIVEVFYSTHDVKRPYKVIGHLTYPNSGTRSVKSAFEAYGKKIGADAIVISGTEATQDNNAGVVNADALKYEN
jgi:hypothetical protein